MDEFGKLLGLAVYMLATIATCAAAFNTGEGFYIGTGLITLLITGLAVYNGGKRIHKR